MSLIQQNTGATCAAPVLHHKLLGVLFRLFQQSADRQGDTLVLGVHIGDLDLHILTLGQNILGLADAAVSDLGNVNQAVHAGQDLSEGTEVIVKPRGSSGTADPLDQRSSVGWKGIHAAAILYDEYIVRVECGSSYSGEDAAN